MQSINTFIAAGGLLGLGIAAVYSLLTLLAVATWRHLGSRAASGPPPPVSVLKPLCNDEPYLYEHLRTFCQQDSANFRTCRSMWSSIRHCMARTIKSAT